MDPDPALRPFLNRGDVLPLSWATDNKQAILERLAPNLALGETTPDFRVARYFQDTPNNQGHLLLRDVAARPILAFGSTPLGASIRAFRTWYTGCASGNCGNVTGWRDLAATHDPDWGCRPKFLLVLTDGDETCDGETLACNGALALNMQESLKTYVVAFGVPGGSSNVLSCMADNGGTSAPVYPQNKQQLIEALTMIFGEIAEKPRAFASAAVPSVQAQVADKIFLTSFTPLNNAAVWPGRVDAYLKPLPLTDAGTPDRDRLCSFSVKSGCRLWDAGEEILAQAPTKDEADHDLFKLGNAPNERRVFYPVAATGDSVPRVTRLFEPPSTLPLWLDLWTGLGVPYNLSNLTPAQNETKGIIRFTLRQKVDTIDNPDGTTTPVTYVLGDVFHATPGVVNTPSRFRYFVSDLYGNGSTCTDTTTPNLGYRCFFSASLYRRKMLLVGSDDDQLHAFDAGIFRGSLRPWPGRGRVRQRQRKRALLDHSAKSPAEGARRRQLDATGLGRRRNERDRRRVHRSRAQRHSGPRPAAVADRRRSAATARGGAATTPSTSPSRTPSCPARSPPGVYLPEPGTEYVPSCLSNYTSATCGPIKFASVLWEFTDGEIPDEDLNGHPDLGNTWSVPNTGRIQVIENGETVDKYVAIFGGGMDPDKAGLAGDWLYMVDFETGKVDLQATAPGLGAERARRGRHRPERLSRHHLHRDHRRLPLQGRHQAPRQRSRTSPIQGTDGSPDRPPGVGSLPHLHQPEPADLLPAGGDLRRQAGAIRARASGPETGRISGPPTASTAAST